MTLADLFLEKAKGKSVYFPNDPFPEYSVLIHVDNLINVGDNHFLASGTLLRNCVSGTIGARISRVVYIQTEFTIIEE